MLPPRSGWQRSINCKQKRNDQGRHRIRMLSPQRGPFFPILQKNATAGDSLAVVFLLCLEKKYLSLRCFAVLNSRFLFTAVVRGRRNTGCISRTMAAVVGEKMHSKPITSLSGVAQNRSFFVQLFTGWWHPGESSVSFSKVKPLLRPQIMMSSTASTEKPLMSCCSTIK